MDGSTALKAEKVHINATLNDDGNALLMVDHIENRLLYCPERKQWLEWSGGHWNWLADNGPAVEAFRVMIREIDPQGDPVIAKHKHRSQSWNFDQPCGHVGAEKDPRVAVHINDLDADPYRLNTPGGGVNLYSGEVSPNTPEFAAYPADASCARFQPKARAVPCLSWPRRSQVIPS
jgi:hypothetical protein